MKIWALKISLTMIIGIVWLVSSCSKKPDEPQKDIVRPPFYGVNAVYVAPGGTGDGSRESPMGSIPQAIAAAQSPNSGKVVVIASGEYHESLDIIGEIHLFGSRNPDSAWNVSAARTLIYGIADSLLITTCAVRLSQADTATLDLLTIHGSDGISTGQSSEALVLVDCDRIQIHQCAVLSGLAFGGSLGIGGGPGIDGESGRLDYVFTYPGLHPVPGGDGGQGGVAPQYPSSSSGKPGHRGFCQDGDSTGGLPGGPGQRGFDGDSGLPAPPPIIPAFRSNVRTVSGWTTVVGDSGVNGIDGINFGCGGGGGGGGSGESSRSGSWAGVKGGGGGAGGGPGKGGLGGSPGGSSIGLLAINSNFNLEKSSVHSGRGGNGGAGGPGGPGGRGGLGGGTDWFPVRGGSGGNGGNGGRGGTGGGGSGGCSFPILMIESDGVYGTTVLLTGVPGSGGGPMEAKGPDGKASAVFVVSE